MVCCLATSSLDITNKFYRKIPWRMSTPQKLRHRRRLRRVDNIVTTLDNALRRQAVSSSIQSQPTPPTNGEPNELPVEEPAYGKATPAELAQTGEGQRILTAAQRAEIEKRRHSRGPRQGEWVPEFDSHGVKVPGGELLGSKARREGTMKVLERWKAEMPTEAEMLPRDKYTMFDRKAKGYRKGVHKLPKWTRVSQRVNPPGF